MRVRKFAREKLMKSYYLTNRFRNLYTGFFLFIIIAGISLSVYFESNLYFQICLLGWGMFGIFIVYKKIQNEHISVSQKGVEYNSSGFSMEVNWENVEKISYYLYNGFRVESLLIDRSHVRIKKWSLFEGPLTPLEGFPNKIIFPLSCYSENWRASELGEQIKQYAPHLFEIEKSGQSA